MISVLHTPDAPFTGEDYRIVAAAMAKSVKIFETEATQHSLEDRALQVFLPGYLIARKPKVIFGRM